MSTKRGNCERTRPQKYKNRSVFRNDMHDKTPKQKMLNTLHISEVCQQCKLVIEWKIKYKKYKPLTQQKTCTKCHQRNIRKAYHVLCKGCALGDRVCAKCMKSSEEVEIVPPEPTESEQIKLKVEMDRLIKALPERKRRAFLRYMKKGKPIEGLEDGAAAAVEQPLSDDGEEGDDEDEPQLRPKRIPHSREDLLKKIEQLTLGQDNDRDDDDSDFSGSDLSDEDESD